MATLLARKSKKTGKALYTVQFVLDGKWPCVRLGSISKTQAGDYIVRREVVAVISAIM